jgi:hypothetical protein
VTVLALQLLSIAADAEACGQLQHAANLRAEVEIDFAIGRRTDVVRLDVCVFRDWWLRGLARMCRELLADYNDPARRLRQPLPPRREVMDRLSRGMARAFGMEFVLAPPPDVLNCRCVADVRAGDLLVQTPCGDVQPAMRSQPSGTLRGERAFRLWLDDPNGPPPSQPSKPARRLARAAQKRERKKARRAWARATAG